MKLFNSLCFIVFALNIHAQFSSPNIISSNFGSVQDVVSFDVDADGDNDVMAISNLDNTLVLYKNDGSGNFLTPITISNLLSSPFELEYADIDKDNDLDIFVGQLSNKKLILFTNDGNGNFTEYANDLAPNVSIVYDVEFSDFNSDGSLDFVLSDNSGDRFFYFEQTNLLQFTSTLLKDQMNGASDITLSDIDEDGDMDVFVMAYFENTVGWFKNEEDSFSSYIEIATVDDPENMQILDYDNDGEKDVLYSSYSSSDAIGVIRNLGNEQFDVPTTLITGISGSRDFESYDFDGDLDYDFVIATASDDILYYAQNNGNSFSISSIDEDMNTNEVVKLADIDGDEDVDVLACAYLEAKIAWYENLYNYVPAPVSSIQFISTDNVSFQNPFKDNLVLNFINHIPKRAKIYDLKGTCLSDHTISNQTQLNIPFLDFQEGMYILELMHLSGVKEHYKLMHVN